MKKLYIVANWKSYKTAAEIEEWFAGIHNYTHVFTEKEGLTVVLCPAFPYLTLVQQKITEGGLPFFVGSQTVSSFGEGKFTGEVNARQLKEFVTYSLVGHSERVEHFAETGEQLAGKVQQLSSYGITAICCVPDAVTLLPQGASVIAYEPPSSISPGDADTPENASIIAKSLKTSYPDVSVLYGGSVTPENVHSFTSATDIDGVLVGNASLDPAQFGALLTNA